jgi:PucR C-terminal helix-turn-helix domain
VERPPPATGPAGLELVADDSYDPSVDRASPTVAQRAADVSGALGPHAVALAAGRSGPRMTSFGDVAPLADDDDHNARLRDTVRVSLQEVASFEATAERLILHKNSVQYRVGKAEEALGRPIDEHRLQVELALLASQWPGATVLRPVGGTDGG